MSTQTDRERLEKRYRRTDGCASVSYVLIPPVVGFIAGLCSDFGRSAAPAYFTVVAEGLLPVFLVTAVLQYALMARRQIEREPSELMEFGITTTLIAAFLLFIVGEGVALFAVAAEASSTFLVVTPLAAGLMFLGDLLFATRHQAGSGFEKYLPERAIRTAAEREARWRLEEAARLESRAKQLRERASDGSAEEPRRPPT